MASANLPKFMYANFWDAIYIKSTPVPERKEDQKGINNEKAHISLDRMITSFSTTNTAPQKHEDTSQPCSGPCVVTSKGTISHGGGCSGECCEAIFDGQNGVSHSNRPPEIDFVIAFRNKDCEGCGHNNVSPSQSAGSTKCYSRRPQSCYYRDANNEEELLECIKQHSLLQMPSTDVNRHYGYGGSCEIIIRRRIQPGAMRVLSSAGSTMKQSLPFSHRLCDYLQEQLHLFPHWLVHRDNDSGLALVTGDALEVKDYLFQTPFYGKGYPQWSLSMAVRNTGVATQLELATKQSEGQYMNPNDAYRFEDGFVCMKTVGILEVDESFNVDGLGREVQLLAAKFRHPLLVPIQLLFWHIQESTSQFMNLEQKLGRIEERIIDSNKKMDNFSRNGTLEDILGIEFGALNEELYRCDQAFGDLGRRFDFEGRFGSIVIKAICWGYKKCRVEDERPLVSWFADINKLHRTAHLAKLIQANLEASNARTLDMSRLPDRIKSLRKLLQNLIAQQESHASLQESRQVKDLTEASVKTAIQTKKIAKATLNDSYWMKTIALITASLLPGTFLAALFQGTMFTSSDGVTQVTVMFWIYCGVTTLLTAAVVFGLRLWINRKRRTDEEKAEVE